jgi:hypothetical protein
MNSVKVYDKLNRMILQTESKTGNITIIEFTDEKNYSTLIINTKIFQLKNDKYAYCSYNLMADNCEKETLNFTHKYIEHTIYDNKKLLSFERYHVKDPKYFFGLKRIYDAEGNFIEIEKHRDNKQVNFTIIPEIINTLLSYGQ